MYAQATVNIWRRHDAGHWTNTNTNTKTKTNVYAQAQAGRAEVNG